MAATQGALPGVRALCSIPVSNAGVAHLIQDSWGSVLDPQDKYKGNRLPTHSAPDQPSHSRRCFGRWRTGEFTGGSEGPTAEGVEKKAADENRRAGGRYPSRRPRICRRRGGAVEKSNAFQFMKLGVRTTSGLRVRGQRNSDGSCQ